VKLGKAIFWQPQPHPVRGVRANSVVRDARSLDKYWQEAITAASGAEKT